MFTIRYTTILVLLLSFCQLSFSQDKETAEFKTLIKDGTLGGYASFGVGYSYIDKRDAIVLKARGGIVIRHILSIGFAGTTFMNDYRQITPGVSLESSLAGGYGGLYTELFLLRKSPIHISIPLVAGIGAVSYSEWDRATSDGFTQTGHLKDETDFFVFESGVDLNLRLAKWLKIGAFTSYRITSPLSERFTNEYRVNTNALEGLNYGVNIKVGKF